jgi:hypothetical protein
MDPNTTIRASAQIAEELRKTKAESNRGVNPRTLRALNNIVEVCNDFEKRKQLITPGAVGAQTERMDGGPSVGGLRNRKEFIAYVAARSSEQNFKPGERLNGPLTTRTGNPQFDTDLNALRLHNQMLVRRVGDLTKLLQVKGPYDLETILARSELIAHKRKHDCAVSQDVREAIGALTDSASLSNCGLELTAGGQIVEKRRRALLLNKAQLSALTALVSGDPVDPSQPDGSKSISTGV